MKCNVQAPDSSPERCLWSWLSLSIWESGLGKGSHHSQVDKCLLGVFTMLVQILCFMFYTCCPFGSLNFGIYYPDRRCLLTKSFKALSSEPLTSLPDRARFIRHHNLLLRELSITYRASLEKVLPTLMSAAFNLSLLPLLTVRGTCCYNKS